jgi:hypothetical protein
MTKSKLSALLSLLLVFASGTVLGAFAYRLYSAAPVSGTPTPGGRPSRPNPAEMRKKYVADVTKEVKLDSEQVKQLNAIMDQTFAEFERLNEKTKPENDALDEKRDVLREKYRPDREAIHNRQVDRINAMLREDQRAIYTAWRAERDRQRKVREQQHKKQ